MTDKDELLIDKFFAEQKQSVEDDGFSKNVMRKLPSKASRYSRIWSTICILGALALFVYCHGFKLIMNSIDVMLRTAPTHDFFSCTPLTAAIAVIVLAGVGIYRLVTSQQ
jgi:TRAP-type C4-dicarboxylate transport system permease small subunit